MTIAIALQAASGLALLGLMVWVRSLIARLHRTRKTLRRVVRERDHARWELTGRAGARREGR